MKSQSQRKGGEGQRVNLLQEYHQEKKIEDQRIQLRKILIWAFIFTCLYFVWSIRGQTQKEYQAPVKEEQSTISANEVGHEPVSDDSTHSKELQIPQVQQPSETIHDKIDQEISPTSGSSKPQKQEIENSHVNGQNGNQEIEEEQVQVQEQQQQPIIETLEISHDSNTQDQPQNVPQQEI